MVENINDNRKRIMKRTFSFVVAAAAAGMAFVSCTKNLAPEQENATLLSEPRIISVEIAATDGLKSTLNGLKPQFEDGDTVLVSNGTVCEECRVHSSAAGTMEISVKLAGDLTAVYPKDCAVMEGKKITGVKVPGVQDGTFSCANISMATLASTAPENSSFVFKNQIALFMVVVPAETKTLTVKSKTAEINTAGEDKKVITIENESEMLSDTCYVALSAGANLKDLSFDAAVNDITGSLKGIPAKTEIESGKESVKINTAYTINDTNWHPYVVVNGKKWATMNIGAESETDPGEYFMWAEVVGHKYIDGIGWTNFPKTKPADTRYSEQWDSTNFFVARNTPYFDKISGSSTAVYSKYTDAKKGLTLLAEDDAANYNWGGTWRMPTYQEIYDLGIRDDETQTTGVHMSDGGKYLVVDGTGLKFNVTGQISGNGAPSTTYPTLTTGAYWTSTGNTGNNLLPYFYFNTTPQIKFGGRYRNCGLCIRPISD